MKILVSGCLLGVNCKYNGGNNYNEKIIEYLKDKEYIVVCPEKYGGLKTPRVPSEIQSLKTAKDVLCGNAKVLSKNGEDVTEYFLKGANEVLDIALKNKCTFAILKESSPSCGPSLVYNGNFEGIKIPGKGVCAKLLEENGIKVISEDDIVL